MRIARTILAEYICQKFEKQEGGGFHCANETRAIEMVMQAEGCPRRAIVKVVSKKTAHTL